jgi:cobalamin biosynthesis protein CobD/CbiB
VELPVVIGQARRYIIAAGGRALSGLEAGEVVRRAIETIGETTNPVTAGP